MKTTQRGVRRIRRRYKMTMTKQKVFVAGEKDFIRDMVIVLKLAGYSNNQIGQSVGVSRGQVKAFLDEPEVAEKLTIFRSNLPQAALDLLQGYSIEAVHAIVDVMRRTQDDAIILKAAAEVLDRAGLPKVSRSEGKLSKIEEHRTTFTDDGIVERLRELPPEMQEEAAAMIEKVENLLSEPEAKQ